MNKNINLSLLSQWHALFLFSQHDIPVGVTESFALLDSHKHCEDGRIETFSLQGERTHHRLEEGRGTKNDDIFPEAIQIWQRTGRQRY